jgi:predicted RNA-binding protein with PIN domain
VRHIIVDGYNVIRADPRLQSFERISLELARDTLARALGSSPRLANDRVTVVFDGRFGNRSHVHAHRLGRIELVFSAQGQTADDVIIERARSLGRHERVIVVTNDVAVRERCRAEGCEVSSSENLLLQIPGGRPSRRQEDEERDPTLSTVKRGNPRRSSRKSRQQRDIRF